MDAGPAAALFAVLGFRWSLLTALAIEAVPVLQLFPAWTLSVLALAALDGENRPGRARVRHGAHPTQPNSSSANPRREAESLSQKSIRVVSVD